MQVPISVVILLIVVIAVIAGLYYGLVLRYPGSEGNIMPVRASMPAGNLVYSVDSSYIIPIRFSKSTDKPIGICKVDINYADKDGNIIEDSVVLAVTSTVYKSYGNFSNGTITFETVVLNQTGPIDTDIIITFTKPDEFTINSLVLYYCVYGVSTTPEWSETLLIPETVLSP